MVRLISPELGEELARLYAELPVAYSRAAEALKTEAPFHRLEGAALQRFMDEDAKAAAIVKRIKEIQGE